MKYLAFEKSVGGVIFRKQGEQILYLLLRYRSGQWDFPKGHVEEMESEDQTLRREVREETGITDLEVLQNFRIAVSYFYSAKGNELKERIAEKRGIYIFKKVAYYACKTSTSEILIDYENKDHAWLTFEQAYKRISNNGSKKVIASAQKAILSGKNR